MPDDSMVEKEKKCDSERSDEKEMGLRIMCRCLWIFIQNSVAVTVYPEKLRRY